MISRCTALCSSRAAMRSWQGSASISVRIVAARLTSYLSGNSIARCARRRAVLKLSCAVRSIYRRDRRTHFEREKRAESAQSSS